MGRTKRSSWLSFAALVVSWSISAQAQTFQGSFAGTVMDDTGAVIPHALVTAAEQNTGLVRSTATLDDGSYEIATT
ncbi:MAG TPA: carboxypeptidase-like regulatory domain-containing protein [Terriglobia bacterium]|nr:carboxypeptidase-like regulatory domain-containing protein [Terriglobia bacterium]